MTYNPNIPTDLPSPSVAVDFIRTNFSQFAALFALNHEAINSNNQGKHDAVLLQSQIVDPGVTGDYDALYCKNFTNTNVNSEMLYMQMPKFLPNGKPNTPQQLTYNQVNITGPVYQSFLPGGYIFYFGFIILNAASQMITLAPTPTAIVCAIAFSNLAPIGSSMTPVSVKVNNATQFTISSTVTTANRISWLAIAKE